MSITPSIICPTVSAQIQLQEQLVDSKDQLFYTAISKWMCDCFYQRHLLCICVYLYAALLLKALSRLKLDAANYDSATTAVCGTKQHLWNTGENMRHGFTQSDDRRHFSCSVFFAVSTFKSTCKVANGGRSSVELLYFTKCRLAENSCLPCHFLKYYWVFCMCFVCLPSLCVFIQINMIKGRVFCSWQRRNLFYLRPSLAVYFDHSSVAQVKRAHCYCFSNTRQNQASIQI